MTYLVSYRPQTDDSGVLALACQFARSESDTVHALTVVPRGWETSAGSATDGEFETWAAEEGEASAKAALEILATEPDITAEATWVTGRSVPAAIMEQAEKLGASLIVVGSGTDGTPGRISVSSKTDRLLHSSPVPVVLAPRGYRPAPGSKITRVTLAFRDDDVTWKLLDEVAEICKRVGAELRLLTVALKHRTMVTSPVRGDEDLVFAKLVEQVKGAQVEALEHLEKHDGLSATVDLARGSTWAEALAEVEWADGDVLVVGSSRTHLLANVFLGSGGAKIVRNSPVPVIVVP
ncbi:MAG: universal stress protein [Micropruina sp.]|uniref:universal stress protein n=1 Tax=Micropruina sp. TaxID=2737536 RepID=UPI0039E5DB62